MRYYWELLGFVLFCFFWRGRKRGCYIYACNLINLKSEPSSPAQNMNPRQTWNGDVTTWLDASYQTRIQGSAKLQPARCLFLFYQWSVTRTQVQPAIWVLSIATFALLIVAMSVWPVRLKYLLSSPLIKKKSADSWTRLRQAVNTTTQDADLFPDRIFSI